MDGHYKMFDASPAASVWGETGGKAERRRGKVLASLLLFFSLVAAIVASYFAVAAVNSTQWSVTCMNVKELVTFLPLAVAKEQNRSEEVTRDAAKIDAKYFVCFNVGLRKFSFSIHTVGEYELGTTTTSSALPLMVSSVLGLVLAILSILLSAVSLATQKRAYKKGLLKWFFDGKTISHTANAEKLLKISGIMFALGLLLYSAQQFHEAAKLSSSSAASGAAPQLCDATKSLGMFARAGGYPGVKHYEPQVLRNIGAALGEIDELMSSSGSSGKHRELFGKFVALRLAVRPCFGRAYYWSVLLVALVSLAVLLLVAAKNELRSLRRSSSSASLRTYRVKTQLLNSADPC